MSDFAMMRGFEDVWRPAALIRPRTPHPILSSASARRDMSASVRLARIARRAPEVIVKITGRTRDAGHLRAHFDYISRNGALDFAGRDGVLLRGRGDIADLVADWSAAAECDPRHRQGSPLSHSIVLSMPAGVDPFAVRDAARAFARAEFEARFDYVLALHTDTGRPHVHMTTCARGYSGERLNPKKADLERWRQTFAQALRDRGVEAEATPRRARGVTRKAERTPIRKLRDRQEAGLGPHAKVKRGAYHEAAKAAFQGQMDRTPWETSIVERQQRVRGLYLAQARLLQRSDNPTDRELGVRVEDFVRNMPAPDTQRLALARELRAAGVDRTQRREGGDNERQR